VNWKTPTAAHCTARLDPLKNVLMVEGLGKRKVLLLRTGLFPAAFSPSLPPPHLPPCGAHIEGFAHLFLGHDAP
jgi:hypothetical protein